MLLKVGLDCLILSLSHRRLHTSFIGICGLSVFLVDVALSCAVGAVWVLGPASPQVSTCFFLAHASAMFSALPLPVLGLGLLDYACFHSAPYRTPWYCMLTLVVWVLAGVHSYCSAFTGLIEVEYGRGRNALGCAVQDSALVVYFSVGIFIHSLIYRYTNLKQLKADEEKDLLGETKWQSPPLYLSLTLGFGTTWASYLFMGVACELLGLAVPAYISVNILWLKCADSLLVGLMFWLRSDWLGPYSDPPDELCQWQVYWHLSRGHYAFGCQKLELVDSPC
uniref:G-protein coupled receptors family 1 profile domain-containing protein n=1 Tax=Esox lucius TaxID=8010 RepID=A0AAY5KEJ7_ESOLU